MRRAIIWQEANQSVFYQFGLGVEQDTYRQLMVRMEFERTTFFKIVQAEQFLRAAVRVSRSLVMLITILSINLTFLTGHFGLKSSVISIHGGLVLFTCLFSHLADSDHSQESGSNASRTAARQEFFLLQEKTDSRP